MLTEYSNVIVIHSTTMSHFDNSFVFRFVGESVCYFYSSIEMFAFVREHTTQWINERKLDLSISLLSQFKRLPHKNFHVIFLKFARNGPLHIPCTSAKTPVNWLSWFLCLKNGHYFYMYGISDGRHLSTHCNSVAHRHEICMRLSKWVKCEVLKI